ncbi:division/cell wall cluster transcriptional repressor MraZ [Fructobacillus tropaeoli]|uniref:Transcriptional regulator MraZ n=1 Tax=Fructobacillus tropaeoli TaxID=709323 RepID=A0A3F3GYQ7_9LACO|nr:division/cell wall cluster transcriptional repressor MraZ [Fructobacillus tropaeoli]NLS38039.1 division/cell wall cluster transcriptional repressor MraZ [Fructobacillus tropaeoli]CAK1228861.1 DNA-binding transcriptional regulator and inhibitor of RsmH methyltransferase activity (MraZ) [Fructobacillus tropaeoli]CAK1230199.1 DNA-binding transcriptional regulator and inhibitor of RsmH methyltransferase activity (MraZ) [Fructobacillus tropaeoli]CAK1233240.1 DNA-binding transcriptional regulator 
MFMGESSHNLDPKGRLTIPVKFRNQLGESFVVVRWMEHALRAMPMSVWQNLEEQLNTLPLGKKEARAFKRFVLAGAKEAEFDKQGRIIVDGNLKDYAQIDKEVVVTGAGDSFEIWSKENWQAYTEDTAENFDEIAEGLVDFDF